VNPVNVMRVPVTTMVDTSASLAAGGGLPGVPAASALV